jgi:hypothetical protein
LVIDRWERAGAGRQKDGDKAFYSVRADARAVAKTIALYLARMAARSAKYSSVASTADSAPPRGAGAAARPEHRGIGITAVTAGRG